MRAHMTEEMFASIPAMLAQGMDRKQIAAHFGTTWASLQAQCCHRSISPRCHDRPKLQKLRPEDAPITLRHEWRRMLHDKAQTLGMDEVRLVTKL